MSGVLYGVGLGPGDPELMTLKAHRLISNAKVIAYPSLEGGDSFARSIAAGIIPSSAKELAITIPMTVEREPAQTAYDKAASDLASELGAGHDVIVLCEGDPFFYGSFMYLFSRLSSEFECRIVPGVTSVTACAAVSGLPLTARKESLTILPGPLSEETLTNRIEQAEAVAIMKVGRHLPKIRNVLNKLGLTGQSTYVERASLPQQRTLPLAEAPEDAPYFSMVLVTKGNDPWL